MTERFRKKVRKYRGLTSHGGGSKKKRRGKGSRGGRGFSGMHKHKFTLVTTKYPDWYGKKGFHSPRPKARAINIDDALELAEGHDINLTRLGYEKLLSMGHPMHAYTITVASCSARAKEKIEKAGGKVIVTGSSASDQEDKK